MLSLVLAIALFAEWSDADTVNAIMGSGGLTAVIAALWYGLTRYSRQRGETKLQSKKVDLEAKAHDDKTDTERYDKWLRETRNLIKLQDQRIEDLDAKIAERDATIHQMQAHIVECQQERATLVEQVRWQKRILKDKGWISDEDEKSYPRTKSDEFRKPPEEHQ